MFIRCSRCGGGAFIESDDKTRMCAACRTDASETSVTDIPPPRSKRNLERLADSNFPDTMSSLEAAGEVPMIRRNAYGENLAVLALLLPVVAQGLALACQFDFPIQMAISVGTVVLTAVLLAVDAAFLGRIDFDGTERANPGAIFLGICLLWIVCYPVVFFRRRHFGRPNLGPLALLVALFFLAGPYLSNFARFGIVGSGVPLCTSKEVKTMVGDLIRTSPIGAAVQSIDQFQETNFDDFTLTRKGECRLNMQNGAVTATFTVKVVNSRTGAYQVEIAPINVPPFCTEAAVTAVVDDMIRAGPNGRVLKKVFGHVETRFDPATKTRHGRCQAQLDNRTIAIDYRVFWDENAKQYLIAVDP